jgi:hypothetical protein
MRRRLASTFVVLVCAGVLAAAQNGYVSVDIYTLGGYYYVMPNPADVKAKKPFKSSIPDRIKVLNGKRVTLGGFMIPFDQAANQVREFMLVASYDACGFGDLPVNLNDWVHVTMRPGKGAYYSSDPVSASGLFTVGEEFDTDGFVMSIYRLDAEGVSAPEPVER